MKSSPFYGALLACIAFRVAIAAPTTYTFTGASPSHSASWFDAANWSPNGVPGAGDTANIGVSNVLVDAGSSDITVAVLTLTDGGVTGTGNFTVTQTLNWTAGVLDGAGTITIPQNATFNISGDNAAAQKVINARTINNSGATIWSGATNIKGNYSATFNNLAGASFTIQNDQGFITEYGTYSFNNQQGATVTKSSGSGITYFFGAFSNTGTLNVTAGTIALQGGGVSTGSFAVNSGAVLSIGNQTFVAPTQRFDPGATVSGDGLLLITQGVLEIDGNLTLANVELESGILTGSGTVDVTKNLTWIGGTLDGTGTLNIPAGAVFSITGSDAANQKVLQYRTINNAGQTVWTGATDVKGNYNAAFNNLAGATFEIQNDQGFITEYGTYLFNNYAGAVFRKPTGTGTSVFTGTFENAGEMISGSGTLYFDKMLEQYGGSIDLAGGSLTLNRMLTLDGGVLKGRGTITGSVINAAATVSPGEGSTGLLQITGDYSQYPEGNLEIGIGGVSGAGTSFDALQVGGSANLEGTLHATLINGFAGSASDSLTVITAKTVSGQFNNTNVQVTYGTDHVDIEAVPFAGNAFGIAPSHGGDSGQVTATLSSNEPFSAGDSVRLTAPGQPDIVGSATSIASDGQSLITTFDLTGKADGVYDVVVTSTNSVSRTLSGGFRVESVRPVRYAVQVLGRPVIRIGNEYKFFVLLTNHGNIDATDVPVSVSVPDFVSIVPDIGVPVQTTTAAGTATTRLTLPLLAASTLDLPYVLTVKIKVSDPNRAHNSFQLDAIIGGPVATAHSRAESEGPPPAPPAEGFGPPGHTDPRTPNDPNEIGGPGGVGDQHYLPAGSSLPYTIYFENLDTASLPAQDVVVTDQLDPALVDLQTFQFGPISFGNTTVTPPVGVTAFTRDVDLRPSQPLIVRITAGIDETGLLTYRFNSLDPNTGTPPEDPDAGFLPPNKVSPEGQAAILFSVKSKTGLAPGTQITDKATITFDVNSSIDTPTWLNTVAFPAQPLNISTRMRVLTGDNVLIGGFIVTGRDPKPVIIRGIGPSLANVVADALSDTVLELHSPDGSVLTNDNWKDSQQPDIEATGIPPSNDLESAIVATLAPGAYTAVLRGKGDATGVGLVEAYDLSQSANSRLANISTRGFVDLGDNVMIGGFIAGSATGGNCKALVRAIGPSLSAAGVAGALQDPTLELHDANGLLIVSNDDWKDSQPADILATGIPPADDRESAIVENLVPGNYTAVVRGKNNATGVALVEVYALQ